MDQSRRGVAPRSERRGSYGAVLTVVVASTFLALTAYTAPLGNAVTLAADFDASRAGLSWILASMSVGLAVTLMPTGVIADRIGRARVFQLGAALFVVANVACALAGTTTVFVLGRLVAGLGATGMVATGLGLVVATDDGPRRQSTTATWWSVAMGGGIAVGPVLSGVFDVVGGWEWCYLLLAAGGLAMWIAARVLVPAQTPPARTAARRFDVLGMLLLTGFLGVLITAIVQTRTGFTATTAILFIVSAVILAAFVLSQWSGRRHLIAREILKHPPFLAATIAGFGTGIGVIAAMSFIATYLVAGLGMSTLRAGAMTTFWSATSAVAALLFARASARITGPTQLVIGLVGVSIGTALLAGVSDESGIPRLIAGLMIAGVASGVLNGGLARQSVATVPPTDTATGTAANNTARYLGASIGVTAASIIATSTDLATGWTRVALATASASLLTAVLVAVLSRPPRGSRPHA